LFAVTVYHGGKLSQHLGRGVRGRCFQLINVDNCLFEEKESIDFLVGAIPL